MTEEKTLFYTQGSDWQPTLFVFDRQGYPAEYPLHDIQTLGRSSARSTPDIAVSSLPVSRRHGEFSCSPVGCCYRDAGSTNGTWINGTRITETHLLADGDCLAVYGPPDEPPAVRMAFVRAPRQTSWQWKAFQLNDGLLEIRIGRSEEAGISVQDAYMSSHHALFFNSSGGWCVMDQNSTNGVYVNGSRIGSPRLLAPMDLIRIGSTWFFFLEQTLWCGQPDMPAQKMLSAKTGSPSAADGLSIQIIEKNVWSRFRKKTLLKDISLTVLPGELVLILGGSGAGKTTLMKAVLGYEKAEGNILYRGMDLYEEYDRIKYEIAYVPQQDTLRLNDSVYHILYSAASMKMPSDASADEIRERTEWCMEKLGLSRERDTLSRSLSGGQRKRLSIATELVGDPSLLFLDEPDSGLDGVMARSLMENLREIADLGKMVMVISHGADRAADLFDKVLILAKSSEDNSGHLVFFGSLPDAYRFFGEHTLEGIVKRINRPDEGGLGMADIYIEKGKKNGY